MSTWKTMVLAMTLVFLAGSMSQAGLVAHWTLDDPNESTTLADATGNYDGTWHGTPLKSRPGAAVGTGTAVEFDGDDYARSYLPAFGTGPMSLSFWLNLDSSHTDGWNAILSLGPGNKPWMLYSPSNPAGALHMVEWSSTTLAQESGELPVDVWAHVVVTTENAGGTGTRRIYVDGVVTDENLVSSVTWTDDGSYPFCIGTRWDIIDNTDRQTHGVFDDIQVYDVALDGLAAELLFANPGESLATYWASTPSPADEADGVLVSAGLSWTAATAADVTGYKVYHAKSTEPNMTLLGEVGSETTSIDPAGDLDYDGSYRWRVDTLISGDPGVVTGELWTFETELSLPQITAQPQVQLVKVGGEAVFTVEAFDPLGVGLDYEWRDPADQAIGGNSPTLTINPVTVGAEGGYYCKITNATDTVDSATADLTAARLVGQWLVAGTGDDPNDLLLDVSGEGNHGVWHGGGMVAAEGPLAGTLALTFDLADEDYIRVADPCDSAVLNYRDQFTVSCWVNTNSSLGAYSGIVAKGVYGSHGVWNLRKFGGSKFMTYIWNESAGQTGVSYVYANDTWLYVAAVYDGSRIYLYQNGREITSTAFSGRLRDSTGEDLIIGAFLQPEDVVNTFYNGLLSDVRVYNYGMDAGEVALGYNGLTGEEFCLGNPPYDFNGDCHTNLEDLAVFANHWLECNWVPDCLQ